MTIILIVLLTLIAGSIVWLGLCLWASVEVERVREELRDEGGE